MVGDIKVEAYSVAVNSKVKHIKKDWGIFFTPQWVIDFMITLINEERLDMNNLKILEPACGFCQFLLGIKNNRKSIFRDAITKIGVEINEDIINYYL